MTGMYVYMGAIHRLARKMVPQFLRPYILKLLEWKNGHPTKKLRAKEPSTTYPKLTDDLQGKINNAIKLTFTGDLILLRDSLEMGYNKEKREYDFSPMFRYVKDVLHQADLNVAIFEGPMAGADKGYSNSNIFDGIPVCLNFPKEYGVAVKDAGFNLVTLANNHLLDKGVEGMHKTIETLNEIGLDHVGAYIGNKKSSTPKVLTVAGKRIAVLAYTYGCNMQPPDFFFSEEGRQYTSVIVPPSSKHFQECKKSIIADFEQAKSLHPDLIMVLPHMGEEFRHKPDKMQQFWCDFFAEQGADIIFSGHPHAVQPIEWRKNAGRDILIVNCPGNFLNTYTLHDGDASMIVECYLDRETGKPIASACIPLYTYCRHGANYEVAPVSKILTDDSVFPMLSEYEYKRICQVHSLITENALGVRLTVDELQERYFLFPDIGYLSGKVLEATKFAFLRKCGGMYS